MITSEPAKRILIVNADDFGLSHGVNTGIIRAHEHGIVTSTSLMVRGSAVREAATFARARAELSVGLHLDLCEWNFRDGQWASRYQVVPIDNAAAVRDEIQRQIEAFVQITGHSPTHLDSHQHVHRREPILSAARQAARELRIPLRDFSPSVTFIGRFYGQTDEGEPFPEGITVERFIEILDSLPLGIAEVGCHPGEDPSLDSCYRLERQMELATLCDNHLRAALQARNITLAAHRAG